MFVFASLSGRASKCCSFMEHSHHSSEQKCDCSKWPTMHDVYPPAAFWWTRLFEASFRASSGNLQSTLSSEGTRHMWWNRLLTILPPDGRKLSSCTDHTKWSNWTVSIFKSFHTFKPVRRVTLVQINSFLLSLKSTSVYS